MLLDSQLAARCVSRAYWGQGHGPHGSRQEQKLLEQPRYTIPPKLAAPALPEQHPVNWMENSHSCPAEEGGLALSMCLSHVVLYFPILFHYAYYVG